MSITSSMNEPTDEQVLNALHEAYDWLKSQRGVEYAELRFVDEASENLRVRDGFVEAVQQNDSMGFGVRVIADGAWGFAAVGGFLAADAKRAAEKALSVARATASVVRTKVRLTPMAASVGRYATNVLRDPFAVSLDEKLSMLQTATEIASKNAPLIRRALAQMNWVRVRKALVTSEGTEIIQRFVYGGAGLSCFAVNSEGLAQRRSLPAAMDGEAGQGGYERVDPKVFFALAERTREEAIGLLHAPQVSVGRRTVILESSQLALQVHESCGHPCELDRAFGTEISLAGGSFLQPELLQRFRYGSKHVNLTADATNPGGLGTFGWDDEGVAASKTPLVQEGMFVGYLSSRESAGQLGVPSSGSMRADGFSRAPLIRMVNVNLEPSPNGPTLEELIADTEDGLFIETNKSWSIDDVRLNFQFGCEVAWEIKHGKKTRMLRDPVYTGSTPKFWGNCDAVCGESDWHLWGITTCGKGEPMQLMQVGHGAAPARFLDVEVGHG